MSDSHNEYLRRLERRLATASQLDRRHIGLGNLKVGIAVAAILAVVLAFAYKLFAPAWILLPVAAFVVLSIYHERVLRAWRRAARAARFYENGIARLEGRWAGKGFGGEEYDDAAHPYAEDLDIFGRGKLYELLCTARLRTGERTLARWLLEPAPIAEIRARHEAVGELRPRLDLREQMALVGDEIRSGISPTDLVRWSEEPVLLDSRAARIGAAVLAGSAVAAAVVWWAYGALAPLFVIGVVEAALHLRYRSRIAHVVERVGKPAYGLALLSAVLARIEKESFKSPKLAKLRRELDSEGHPPSWQIARLNRLMDMLDSRDNVAVRVIGPPLMWTTQLAFAIEAWRKHNGASLRRWVEAVGEIEALNSLASHAYEHPQDPFPELVEEGPCFDAEQVAHPLLHEKKAVRNDVRLGPDLRVLVVSGSNMSGKSTLLRTVGTNAVLAMAGAPVRARRLRIAPVTVGASIRTLDSLQDGTSRFYAEVKRLRLLVELTGGEAPLLFLLDELLHGTNSHDRKLGGEAVVRSLVERGSFGLLTTHDLALAHIADELAPRAQNVHFEDHIEEGKITFDYKLRPGVVRKSNALELMRSVGLEV
jgi:hypothetical protein